MKSPARLLRLLLPASLALAALCASLPGRADSLWSAKPGAPALGMVSDRKAAAKGDILNVIVEETAAADRTLLKTSNHTSSTSSAITQFLFSPLTSGLGTNGGKLPATSFNSTSAFSGGGEVTNNQTLSASTAVVVTDVLPNGNLVIQGVRLITISGETQSIVLHGVVRADDVSAADTVASSSVADARLELVTRGTISDQERSGWLTKIYNVLRPY
jgi:flagellar L-ring protein precursor FlgH